MSHQQIRNLMLLCLVVVVSVISACSDDDLVTSPASETARLRIIHVSPDTSLVYGNIAGDQTDYLVYGVNSEYESVNLGEVTVDVRLAASDQVIFDNAVTLDEAGDYSLLLLGGDNGIEGLLLRDDSVSSLAAQVSMRFVHVALSIERADVYVTTSEASLETPYVADLEFGEVSPLLTRSTTVDTRIRLTDSTTNDLVYDSGTLDLSSFANETVSFLILETRFTSSRFTLLGLSSTSSVLFPDVTSSGSDPDPNPDPTPDPEPQPTPQPEPTPDPNARGVIEGQVWYDRNANGTRDAGEASLDEFIVFLDANSNNTLDSGERSVITDADGRYLFENLSEGSYTVSQQLPVGWTNTFPSNNVNLQIVGGQDASIEEYPFMVSLNAGGRLCGGTLIASRWVLTAAHCVEAGFFGALPASLVTVRLGTSNLEEDGLELTTTQVLMHPNYQGSRSNDQSFDVALLELPEDQLMSRMALVTPELGDAASPGTRATILGWGLTSDGGETSDVLQEAQVPIISNDACDDAIGDVAVISEGIICAGYEDGEIDSCQGDSGGPLMVPYESGWLQAGITSFGVGGCAQPDSPGGYARVSTASDWILDTIPAEASQQYVVSVSNTAGVTSVDFGNFR
ncbi:MAG: trypsin-like serine protease [Deinococcota bacterium]